MTSRPGAPREDKIGKWSEEKLKLLSDYLGAYSTIMNGKKKEWLRAYHYIDAFAGSVRPRAKGTGAVEKYVSGDQLWVPEEIVTGQDSERYIEGSPLRALQVAPPFDVCWFIELSNWRLGQLESLPAQFPDREIRIRKGDCNSILRDEIIPTITWESYQRGFVFLDPYGLQVEWETVKALGKARTFDVFVNFSLMPITRLLKRDEPPDEKVIGLFNRVMGNSEWLQELYRPSTQTSMFEDERVVRRDSMRAEWLAAIYAEQLKQHFPSVSNPVIMTNSKNAPLYALFLASQKPVGVKIMNQIGARSISRRT